MLGGGRDGRTERSVDLRGFVIEISCAAWGREPRRRLQARREWRHQQYSVPSWISLPSSPTLENKPSLPSLIGANGPPGSPGLQDPTGPNLDGPALRPADDPRCYGSLLPMYSLLRTASNM